MSNEIIPLEAEDVTPSNAPVIVHEGRYRLYRKPDGTLRVQYRRTDKTEDDFFEIPGFMLKLAQNAADGKMNPMQMMQQAMKLMGGRRV